MIYATRWNQSSYNHVKIRCHQKYVAPMNSFEKTYEYNTNMFTTDHLETHMMDNVQIAILIRWTIETSGYMVVAHYG